MAVAHVQSTGIQSVGSVDSVSKAFASNVTAGNLIVAGGVTNISILSATAMSDTLSNTYTQDVVNVDQQPGVGVYSAPNIAGGACTVTFNANTGNDYQTIGISEFSGTATAAPIVDGTVTLQGSTATPTGNCTTGRAGVTFGLVSWSTGTPTLLVGTGYTLGFEDEDSSEMAIGTEWQLTNPGTRAVNWTLSVSNLWGMCGVGYREAPGGSVASGRSLAIQQRMG